MMGGICFVAHTALGELLSDRAGSVGGIQRQQSLMARWLAARGHRVTMITWDEGQPDGLTIDGVRVVRLCRRDAGLPGVRFFYPRWTSLLDGLRRADADLYYHNSAEYVTGQVALWCHVRQRRFIYSVASDRACEANLSIMPTRRERLLYRYGLRQADRVITQTRHQQYLLRSNFGVESLVLPMPCPGLSVADYVPPRPPLRDSARVLWVGRIAKMKQPEMLLDIAGALPWLPFDLVGAPDPDTPYGQTILAQARALPNVTVHEQLDRERLSQLYQRAAILCCTSSYEGFPNTFLEAWSYGLPVVSMVDPDSLIEQRRLGVIARDLTSLVAAIQRILSAPDEWGLLSASCRRYYLAHHTPDFAMEQFERVFQKLLPSTPTLIPVTPPKRPDESPPLNLREVACPLCGGRDHGLHAWAPAHDGPGRLRVTRCRSCGMIFTNPQPTGYVQQVAQRGLLARHLVPALLERQRRTARFVLELLKPLALGRRLLDFGCGEGVLVHEAHRQGWNAIGLDLNHGLVAAANTHWRFEALVAGSVDEFLNSRPDHFDVIVSSQVFEHLQRPVEVGRELVSLLKPGGLLYIDVPNVRQLGERVTRGRTLDPTAHWNHFSLGTLSMLAVRLGCAIVYASGAPSLVEHYHRLGLGRFAYPLGRLSKRLLPGIGTGVCVIGRGPA